MENIPKVVVLLAAYNGEKWIEDQILSIINQNDVNLDIYISLDLSTDNTLNIVVELSKKYSQITFLPYGKKFGGAAPNFYHLLLNVPLENYEYIALSDQDDLWLENKLKRSIDVLNIESAFGYSSNVIAFWENGNKKIVIKDYSQSMYDYFFEAPGPGCSFVLEKKLALSIKEYLRSCSSSTAPDLHDWLIYAFARVYKYKWVIDNNSNVLYRQHENNQVGANLGCKAFFGRIKNILSGYGINQSLRLVNFLGLKEDSFVSTWYKNDKINYMRLAINAGKCRRRIRDKIYFFLSCILMSILRPKLTLNK